jgi:hypothetical protein
VGAPVSLELDLGEDSALVAGETEKIGVVLTNTSSQPLYRVVAVAHDHGLLDGAEFVFGKLMPGESRRFEHPVTLIAGQAPESAPLRFEIRDAGDGALAEIDETVVIKGQPLPRFAWSWSVTDGDADGVIEPGDDVIVHLEVENVGEGPATRASARLRTDQRKVVDIVEGNLSLGALVGECKEADPIDCERVLRPGEKASGDFTLTLTGEWSGVIDLDLEINEERAYDHASVIRAAFYEFYGQNDQIKLIVGAPAPVASRRETPEITVSRAPDQQTGQRRGSLSGVVTDDVGLDHVMVFQSGAADARGATHGDKVFFEGSGSTTAIRSLPFTADLDLQPGVNVITVLATDRDGLTSTRSVITWFDDGELAKLQPR